MDHVGTEQICIAQRECLREVVQAGSVGRQNVVVGQTIRNRIVHKGRHVSAEQRVVGRLLKVDFPDDLFVVLDISLAECHETARIIRFGKFVRNGQRHLVERCRIDPIVGEWRSQRQLTGCSAGG